MMIELSKRLQAVADMVSPGMRLADVGTDHGYIPIWLVTSGKIPSAIAMDINEGPLRRAKEHIKECGLEEKIAVRLSDGLKNLKKEEADTVIAAGMGGGLVIRILSEGDGKAKHIREYILQPQSEIGRVREYLQENGYRIVQEDMVLEEGKFYPMMKVVEGSDTPYTGEELAYGRYLLRTAHPVLKQFLEKEIETLTKILEGLVRQSSVRAEERREEIRHKINTVEAVLAEYY